MQRNPRKPQVDQSPSVKTVAFQAHAISHGDSIHLKLPGGLVTVSPDPNQPSGHPYLHAAIARLFE